MKAFGQRKGRIIIGREFLDSLAAGDIAKLFRNFFVIKVELDLLSDNIYYYGVSPFFDEIEKGTMIPEYSIEIKREVHDEIDWENFDVFKDPVEYKIGSIKFIRRDIDEPKEVKRDHKLML